MEMAQTPTIRKFSSWKLRDRTLELGRRTLVCGVVNVTPDSFSDGGRFLDAEAAIEHALSLLDDGAHLLDLGAESTRPGSRVAAANGPILATIGGARQVTTGEEQARLLPVVEGILKARPEAILSIDTYKAATASTALAAGAQIINDVSGFNWDPLLAGVCAEWSCGVVLMHTRGLPEEWKAQSRLEPDELLGLVRSGLTESLGKAAAAGVPEEAIALDPGYGFGKRGDENFSLLARQGELLTLGRPLLAGVSRKSFLGRALSPLHKGQAAPVAMRETASVAALVASILQGASVVRVHHVRSAVEAALVADAIVAASKSGR